uniref:Uncharacterized protein n=1 Tax=Rangifer tarandus platyrhynchus TaxID=3082113 RepID=A0ACB0F606_RANTA|nr:unnamed protein product [Rangifer tarandus platyrhynchus]
MSSLSFSPPRSPSLPFPPAPSSLLLHGRRGPGRSFSVLGTPGGAGERRSGRGEPASRAGAGPGSGNQALNRVTWETRRAESARAPGAYTCPCVCVCVRERECKSRTEKPTMRFPVRIRGRAQSRGEPDRPRSFIIPDSSAPPLVKMTGT